MGLFYPVYSNEVTVTVDGEQYLITGQTTSYTANQDLFSVENMPWWGDAALAETFIEAWRLAAREEDFSLVDKIYHPDYSSFDYIAGVEVNLESDKQVILTFLITLKNYYLLQKNLHPLVDCYPLGIVTVFSMDIKILV